MKNSIDKLLKTLLVWKTSDSFALKSYSQEGEDMILRRFFEGRTTSKFYVDVGAHHPYRFSNTYFFYKQGWNGINIDAMPDSMKAFDRDRPRDINLEIAIAAKQEILKYTQFNISALNSFSQNLIESRKSLPSVNVIAEKEIEAYPLATVLSNYLPSGQAIAFLSIDVEGLDLQVLESNDWSRFRPYVVLVEIQQSSLHSIQNNPIYQYIIDQDYYLYAKAFHTVFFVSKEYWNEYFN